MRNKSSYPVVFRVLPDGERYPFLLGSEGIPLWYPTLFATCAYRNGSRAPNTTRAAISAVRLVVLWAELEQIDLNQRFGRGHFLSTSEIESLVRALNSPKEAEQTESVRRQNIWRRSRLKLAECGPRLGVDIRRQVCGVASADVRWFVA